MPKPASLAKLEALFQELNDLQLTHGDEWSREINAAVVLMLARWQQLGFALDQIAAIPAPHIVVYVSGGNVQMIRARRAGIAVTVKDDDNIAAGDTAPTLPADVDQWPVIY